MNCAACATALAAVALLAGCGAEAPPCSLPGEAPAAPRGNAGCLIERRGEVLLIRHRLGGKLGLPGGRSSPGEPGQCTAERETWEETGIAVSALEIVARMDTGFLLYRCRSRGPLPDGRPAVPRWAKAEVAELVWADPRQVPAAEWRFQSQRKAVRAGMAREAR